MVEKFVLKIYFLHSFNLDKKIFLHNCLSMGRFAQINSKFKQKPFFKVKFLLLGKFYFYKTKRVRYMMTSSIFEKMNSKGCKIFRRWEQTQKGCYAKKKFLLLCWLHWKCNLSSSTSTLCIFFWIMFPLTFK